MRSPAPAIADDGHRHLQGEDEDEDDTEDDDVSMEDDIDDEVEVVAPASPSSSDNKTDGIPNPNSVPAAAIQISPISSLPAATPIESRRLFQRLWTDDDEIVILQGFYEFTSQRGTTHHAHQHDMGPFYEQIRSKIQLDFTKSQLVEKLRRLKKKYRNVVDRIGSGKVRLDFAFKSPHDRATFEISKKVWGSSLAGCSGFDHDHDEDDLNNEGGPNDDRMKKRGTKRPADAGLDALPGLVPVDLSNAISLTMTPILAMPAPGIAATAVPTAKTHPAKPHESFAEETANCCFGMLFKELLSSTMNMPLIPGRGIGFPASVLPMSSGQKIEGMDEKWRKQQILELEVYSKRLELVQEQIKTVLVKLRSGG